MAAMCGRLVIEKLSDMAGLVPGDTAVDQTIKVILDLNRYNVSPKSMAVVVRQVDGIRTLSLSQWGFQGDKGFQINSRRDTLAKYPRYFAGFGRILVPVSGFYEWPVINGRKRAYYIHPAEPATHWWFAGLTKPGTADESSGDKFSLVTTDPSQAMSELHDRWPIILPQDALDAWIDPATKVPDLLDLIRMCPDKWIEAYEVGSAVGNTKASGPGLIVPIAKRAS